MSFFYEDQFISPEQKIILNIAKSIYEKVQKHNTKLEIQHICSNDKKLICSKYDIKSEKNFENLIFQNINSLISYLPQNNGIKSSLLSRILNNKNIYIYKPPLSHFIPMYSYLETQQQFFFTCEEQKIEDFIVIDKMQQKELFLFNSFTWNIIEKLTDTHAYISCRFWEQLGFIWEIKYQADNSKWTLQLIKYEPISKFILKP